MGNEITLGSASLGPTRCHVLPASISFSTLFKNSWLSVTNNEPKSAFGLAVAKQNAEENNENTKIEEENSGN